MNRKVTIFFVVVLLLSISGYLQAGDPGDAFCYVSLVEGDAFVLQSDADESIRARVNLPITPGDTLITGNEGRCELQFDNGTVMRLDTDSRLKVHVLQAESLTTNWKITSLELLSGRLFSMNNIYNREMFQVATSVAAIKMNKHSTSTISIEEGNTHVAVERGNVGVLYGNEKKSLRKDLVRAGKRYVITGEHKLIPSDMRPGSDFQLWNQYMNTHFKELHRGISKIPKPIYKFPPGVVKFAEKWSSMFGEWVYNDLFGYVWKPYDESFQYPDKRPFFNADHVRVKDELYLVPQQPWGWIPAHLGNWVWMKKNGWVWIPGTAFKGGMYGADWLWNQMSGYRPYLFWVTLSGRTAWGAWPDYFWLGISPGHGPSGCSTLSDWLYYVYGDYEGYKTYRESGNAGWRARYEKSGKSASVPPPSLKDIPPDVAVIVEKLDKVPMKEVNRYLNLERGPGTRGDSGKNARRVRNWLVYRGILQNSQNLSEPEDKKTTGGRLVKGPIEKRDWNPDQVIARRLGMRMEYSSSRNAVMLPELRLSSRTISDRDRFRLRTTSFQIKPGMTKTSLIRHFNGGSAGSVSGAGAGSTGTAVSRGSAGNSSTGVSKGGTSISANEKK